MSGASVCVLTPNGRRQTVKCTPNTTLLQILEEVCRKQGFQPEEYDLKHHNKVLDTSTTFRFSGLPNNAALEMAVALKSRTESNITLAINLENGERLLDSFKPNDTLLNILNKVCPEAISKDKNPVVIYTRREIYGKELENCTLRSLGLTGGRAMIRIINRDPELLKQQANVSALLPSKPVEEKPYQRKFQPIEQEKVEEKIGNNSQEKTEADTKKEENNCIKPQKCTKSNTVDILKLAREKRKSNESPVHHQDDKRKPTENVKKLEQYEEPMDTDSIKNTQSSEAKTTYISQKSIEEEFVFLGDRNAMLFSLESASCLPSEELPDDFFDLTIDDAKKILRDINRKQQEMENAPLQTKELRNLEESKRQLRQLSKYKKAIIRVQFPNRTILQGSFKPTDTIGNVMEFVREYLEDKNQDFYIYSTPPKCILEKNSCLMEVGCVPGALLYFGTNQDKKDPLRKDLQDKFTTNSVASLAAARMRQENTRKLEENDDEEMEVSESPSTITNNGASTSTGVTHERKIVRSTEKVPKWFKQ